MYDEEMCGNCKWHCRGFYNGIDDDYTCENEDSENYTLVTDFEDTCLDWEGR